MPARSPKPAARTPAPRGKPVVVAPASDLVIRKIRPTDSISEITHLLHRAYAGQIKAGLQPLAGRQGDDVTADRAAHSECFLALLPDPKQAAKPDPKNRAKQKIVGVILFEEKEKATFPPFFLKPHVCHFAQFGVDPDMQGKGIGRALLEKVEERARELGAEELALSMAEPDRPLYDFYINRGFRFVEFWQWPYTNYRSCILSKAL